MIDKFTKFKHDTEGRWHQIFHGLFEFKSSPNSSGWIQCKSPLREEKTPSFSFNVQNGWSKDFSTGESLSGLDLITHLAGLKSRPEAMEYALNAVGRSVKHLPEKSSSKIEYIKRLWESSKPITRDDASWKYLFNRGIRDETILSRLKCRTHPGIKLFDKSNNECVGVYKAMVFQYYRYNKSNIVDADGVLSGINWVADWCGIHVTHITDDFKKVQHAGSKKMFQISGLSGSVIPLLSGDKKTLSISEGIENALAWEHINNSGTTVVAAGSATIMTSFRLTDNLMERVEHFNILGDLDRSYAGQAAAFQCANNLATRGKSVEVLFPSGHLPRFTLEKGQDWADMI